MSIVNLGIVFLLFSSHFQFYALGILNSFFLSAGRASLTYLQFWLFSFSMLVSLVCARIGTGIDRQLLGIFCCCETLHILVAKPGIFVYFSVVEQPM